MEITIVSTAITTERGLGELYRIEQLRDGTPWVHLIARSAVAADMELFGVDDPVLVVDWHLHEALAPLTDEPSEADRAAFDAQQLGAAVLRAAAHEHGRRPAAPDLAAAAQQADAIRDKARELKAAEIAQIRARVTVRNDAGFANLRALIAHDRPAIDVARDQYRERIATGMER